MIHVIRNPYDNIASIARRIGEIAPHVLSVRRGPLQDAIDYYFALCETVSRVREERRADILDVRHAAFVASVPSELVRITEFLGLQATDDYLRACASIVHVSPQRTRVAAEWSPTMIRQVADRLQAFPYLQGYTFESE